VFRALGLYDLIPCGESYRRLAAFASLLVAAHNVHAWRSRWSASAHTMCGRLADSPSWHSCKTVDGRRNNAGLGHRRASNFQTARDQIGMIDLTAARVPHRTPTAWHAERRRGGFG